MIIDPATGTVSGTQEELDALQKHFIPKLGVLALLDGLPAEYTDTITFNKLCAIKEALRE